MRGQQLVIYRIVGASVSTWIVDGVRVELPGRQMGAFNAQLASGAWSDLPYVGHDNPRTRFWFTEKGWARYGRRVAAEARATGRTYRVMRAKNPPRSAVVYRDAWQVAVLPGRHLTRG